MRLRKVPPQVIVEARILSCKAGLPVDTNLLEAHYLSRGNVLRVIQALIAANKANIKLDFKEAAAIDLAGRNVLEAVQMLRGRIFILPLQEGIIVVPQKSISGSLYSS